MTVTFITEDNLEASAHDGFRIIAGSILALAHQAYTGVSEMMDLDLWTIDMVRTAPVFPDERKVIG